MTSGHIDPEIADGGRGGARKAAHQRESHRETGRRRQKVMNGEAEHLGQMAHRGLAAIILPVGVGDKAHRCVEREVRRHRVKAARVQWEEALQALQDIERQESGDGEREHRQRIDKPVLLVRWINSRQAIEAALDRSQCGTEKGSFARVYVGNEFAERYGAGQNQREHKRDLRPADERHRITL